MYGHEDMTTLMAGVANKTGYNIEFMEGKFIVQPKMFLSYSFLKTFNYTNAAGLRINSDPMHVIQINPGIKFIGNIKEWQPYINFGVIWNPMNYSNASANGVKLPQMETKPYVEYGIGLQKCWNDKYSAYVQAMARSGGRNGVALTGGFRWAIGPGENSKKPEKVMTPPDSIKATNNEIKNVVKYNKKTVNNEEQQSKNQKNKNKLTFIEKIDRFFAKMNGEPIL